jgi:hypothetical protein
MSLEAQSVLSGESKRGRNVLGEEQLVLPTATSCDYQILRYEVEALVKS